MPETHEPEIRISASAIAAKIAYWRQVIVEAEARQRVVTETLAEARGRLDEWEQLRRQIAAVSA